MKLKKRFHFMGERLRGDSQHPPTAMSVASRERQVRSATSPLREVTPSWGFGQILENIDVGILVLDLERQGIDYRNPVFKQVLQDEELCADYQALHALLIESLEERGEWPSSGPASVVVSHRGRMFGCSVYEIATRYRCIFIRDITEKLRLESIAQAVNTMDNIGFIFSGIRHEIGNPLNSLKMTLSVLRQNLTTFSGEMVSEYIERSLADIGRMEYLLKSLKNFSMYEHVDLKDFALGEFMQQFLSLVEPDFSRRGVALVLESSLEVGRVRIDQRALHQALLNILANAADALEGQPEPQLRIRAERRDGLAWLCLSDNGCGISSEQQKHLFQPFNTSKPNGNGLGLVITRKLLAMMNSSIEIESVPRQGTRVTLGLPVSEPADEAFCEQVENG